MAFDLSGIGRAIWILYLIAVALSAWYLRSIAGQWPRVRRAIAVVAMVVAVMPLVEELYIASRFEHHCKQDGLWVPEVLVAEGYFHSTLDAATPGTIERGFNFIEYRPSAHPGKIGHLRKRDGGYEEILLDQPMARYEYRMEYMRGVVDYKIRMIQDALLDRQTGKPAATDTRYLRYPAWLDSLWLRFFGIQGRECSNRDPIYLPYVIDAAVDVNK